MSRGLGRVAGAGGVFAASLALCLAGIGTVTQGIAVPVRARIAQHGLEKVFEQRLAASGAARTEPGRRIRVDLPPERGVPQKLRRSTDLPRGGPIARLSVKRLGVRDIVLAGEATHDRLALGPTMLKRGDRINPVTVLAAHRDTHFLFIRDLREGDEVNLQFVTGAVERYRVMRFETVRWDRFSYPLDPARPLLALTTCYPFGGTEYGGPWRRVAWAEKIN